MPKEKFLSIDLSQFNTFRKDLKKFTPNKFRRVMVNVLNNQAFAVMNSAKKQQIPKAMTTRGTFNQRSIRVDKATFKDLEANAGAVKRFTGTSKDYTGLADIELGRTVKNPGIPTTDIARKGSKNKKVTKRNRYAGFKDVIKVQGSTAPKVMSNLSRRGFKGTMYIRSGLKSKKGFYRFVGPKKTRSWTDSKGNRRTGKGAKLVMVKSLEHKTTKTKRVKWLWRSTMSGANERLTGRYFINQMNRVFRLIKRR